MWWSVVPLKALASASAISVTVGAAALGAVAVATGEGDDAVVVRVVDGDTMDVRMADGRPERVRLLNVDTPETVDPDESVQCLGPEASRYLSDVLGPGEAVTLTYDVERRDQYGRLLAGVGTDDIDLVNARIAALGLGVAVVYEPNRRYYQEVLEAQQEAATTGRGLFAVDVPCTLPARVSGVEAAAAAAGASTAITPEDLDLAAAAADGAGDGADGLRSWFNGPHRGPVWAVFAPGAQNALLARIAAAGRSARAAAIEYRGRAGSARDARASAARAAADAQRVADEQARVQRRAQATADAAVRADAERRARAARSAASANQSTSGGSTSGGGASSSPTRSSGGSSDGYTGPRCYAPGGKTYRPC